MTADVAETGVAALELTQFVERWSGWRKKESHFRRYSRSLRGNERLRVRCEGRTRRDRKDPEAGPFRTQGDGGQSRTLHVGIEHDVSAVRRLLLQSFDPHSLPRSRGKARRRGRTPAWRISPRLYSNQEAARRRGDLQLLLLRIAQEDVDQIMTSVGNVAKRGGPPGNAAERISPHRSRNDRALASFRLLLPEPECRAVHL